MTLKTLCLALGALALPAMAHAHAMLTPTEAIAGAPYRGSFAVGHGCGGSPTISVRVTLPEGFALQQADPVEGWTLDIAADGRAVTWTGGPLPDGEGGAFAFQGRMPATGDSVAFPVLQQCETGSIDWADTSGAQGVRNPAPVVAMLPSTGAPIILQGGFTRATLPNAKVGGGYLTITNASTQDDRLVAVSTPATPRAEIHEMQMDGDVMRMRPLPDGVPVPAGSIVELRPGGLHLMFMELPVPFVQGETIPVTLTFEKAGEVQTTLTVEAPNARMQGHGGH